MKYTKFKYKFVTRDIVSFELYNVYPDVTFDWCSIKDNTLIVNTNYAWDGASGPVINTKNSLAGTLVHDCLSQLMRLGLLSNNYRQFVDNEFLRYLKRYGMNPFRAFYWYLAVRLFGKKSATVKDNRDIVLTLEKK